MFNKDPPPIPSEFMPKTVGRVPDPLDQLEAELADAVRETATKPEETRDMQDRPAPAPATVPYGAPTRPEPAPTRSFTPAPPGVGGDYKAPKHVDAIKERLKALTHREMRDLVAEIFQANKKGTDADTITRAEMPDVLDRLAYGD
jgi:hypothetical protein